MQKTDEKILIEAGLSEEQALTYQGLLERGPQKASSIASWTGIKRSLTYKILEQLESLALVSKKGGSGTVSTFIANHPSLLLNKLEKDKKQLELATETVRFGLNSFVSQFNLQSGKPNVQFSEGLAGLKNVYADILTQGTEILLIRSPHDNKYPEIVPIVTKQITDQIIKNIHTRAITPVVNTTQHTIQASDEKNLVTRKLIKLDEFNEPAQIIIYGKQKVAITSFGDQMISTIIDDVAIHSAFKALFEFIWARSDSPSLATNSAQSPVQNISPTV